MRNKCFKRICSVFMAVLMMVCGALSYIGGTAKNVYAEEENLQSSAEVSDSQLKSELSELYQKCLQNSGKSNFHGWCGSFVGHQLKALGISTKTSSGFTGNGNTWYPCLLNNVETDSGHTQVKYPGRDCLKNIVADSGDEPAYNIVVSFPNSTGSNTSYGHVIFIYAIVGNTAHYIESYGTKFGAEGTPIARNIDELMNEYCGLYGNAQGAVWFSGGGGLYYVNDNEMYSTYPWYLKDSTYDQIFSNSRAEINNALHEADKSSAIIAITTAMKEGKDLLIKELLSLVSDEIDSTSEEALDAATVDFIQTMLGNETFLTSSIKSIEKNVKQIKLVCDFTTEVGKTEFAESAGKLLGQSSSAIKTKLDKLLGDNSKMLKIAKYGLKVSEVVAASVELEYINIEIVERIGELLETYGYDDTELYEGISRLITKLHTGMLDRIFDKIADDAVLEILSKVADTALELLVSEDMGFVIAIIDLAAQISVVLIYEKLFDGIKLDDTLEAYAKNQFMDVLFSLKADMQIDMLYGQADSDTIAEDYELIWNAYRACIVSGLDSAKSITRSKSQQSICQQWMNTLTTTCSYDSFFERCRASAMEAVSNGTAITVGSSAGADAVTKSEAIVVKKLNSLLDMYPSGESTFEIMYNNKMGSFAFTEFVFNMLFNNILNGTISTSAQYRYSKYNSVKNVGTLSGSEISEDAIGMLMENAKIGDVILAYGEKYGVHSMIFKEASENGITVYDCGWDSENNGEYGVLLHEIPYSELASWTGTGTTESEGGLSLYHYYDYDHLYTNSGSIMADDKENFIIDENGVLTGYKGYKTFIKIPDTVTSIADEAFYNNDMIRNVYIPSSVTSIGARAFYDCDQLTSVFIPDSVITVGSSCFYSCGSLVYAKLSQNMGTISSSMFYDCKNLETVVMGMNVTEIGSSAFYNCVKLADVELPGGLVTLGGGAFENCRSIVKVTIPKSLTECGYWIFDGCSNLKIIDFEEGITKIPNFVFKGMDGLEEIYIPDTVTTIGSGAFDRCEELVRVTGMKNVTSIGSSAFYNCVKLEEIELPGGLVTLGGGAFQNCKSLLKITIPDTLNSWGTSIFSGCSSLTQVDIPDKYISIPSYMFNGCTSLSNIKLPDQLQTIESCAFQDSGLTEITIPDNVKSIGSYSFQKCTSLIEANISDSVTSMGSYVFDGCSSLTDVSLGSGITSIPDYAFSNCESLEAIKIPYNVTTIGNYVFFNDTAFKEITIPRKTENINSNSFSYPNKLTIYGISGTYAETFASDNSINFVNREVNAEKAELDVTEVTLLKGESKNLIMTVTPSDFTDGVTWKSTDTNVVTVTDAGVINAVGAGTATVKLTVGNVSASCKVTVLQPVTSISLDRTSLSLDALGTYQLVAWVYPSTANNQNVVWESSDTSVATVDENGLVTALKKGTTTITVKSTDGSNISRSCTVTVNNTVFNCDTVEQLESPHNYTDSCSDSWMYTLEGAEKLNVTFDAATAVEDGFDYIYIYTADNTLVGGYTGSELSGKTILVEGDTIRIKLVSDSSGNEWGFKVTSVQSVVTHQMSFIPAVAATCTEDGNNAYYYCSDCDKYFKDEAGTIETTVEAEKIAATGHSEVTDEAVEATCETEGKTEGSHCSVCGEVIRAQETVDKKEHGYENGHCIYCGRSQYTASWIKDDNGWKYRNADGTFVNNGWKAINSKWYYFDNSGYMQTGWKQIDSKWYYLESTGKMATGWKQISGSWYYFESSGVMAANKWVDSVYYMKANGAMAVSEWVDGGRYYVDSNGKWVPNKTKASWKKDAKGWWYDNGDGTYPKSAWKSIDGSWYYFNNSGYMVTGWLNDGGKWYYLESSGKMATSKWIDGTYYVKSNGVMATNEWVDNGRYYVDANGKWVANKTA